MTAFFRYPHTPHLVWLGNGQPRDDKVLTEEERGRFLSQQLIIEEKVDGANIGFSASGNGDLRIQNRGTYLAPEFAAPQFKALFTWANSRRDVLLSTLQRHQILFGEWCYAVHTVRYTELPDWFLAFDVYDRARSTFLSVAERDALVRAMGFELVPRLGEGRYSLDSLRTILGKSSLGAAKGEGLFLRPATSDAGSGRAKLVTPEFTQAIGEHWSKRSLRTNSLAEGVPWF